MQAQVDLEAQVDAARHAAGDEQPVDVAERQPGVGGGKPDRVGGELRRGAPVGTAELGHAEPGDDRAAPRRDVGRGHARCAGAHRACRFGARLAAVVMDRSSRS